VIEMKAHPSSVRWLVMFSAMDLVVLGGILIAVVGPALGAGLSVVAFGVVVGRCRRTRVVVGDEFVTVVNRFATHRVPRESVTGLGAGSVALGVGPETAKLLVPGGGWIRRGVNVECSCSYRSEEINEWSDRLAAALDRRSSQSRPRSSRGSG
jgi:hypothetical protein